MPKSITFFSRGKTPIYVNYVIAHNNVGRPPRIMMNNAVRRPQKAPRMTVFVIMRGAFSWSKATSQTAFGGQLPYKGSR